MSIPKKLAILGLGLSGRATVTAMQARGLDIVAWDDNPAARQGFNGDIIHPLTPDILQDCVALIAAPGIPNTNETIQAARNLGLEIICDIEAWHRLHPEAHTIAITGTNGKSTVTAMIHHILQACDMPSQMGGNIGKAIFDLNSPAPDEWIVLELSSYQIERCPTFQPAIAIMTNITPDHLDRHGTIDQYAAIKARLFKGKGQGIIATDDNYTTQIADIVSKAGQREIYRVSGYGNHTDQNKQITMALADILELDSAKAQAAIKSFQPLPHRQSPVRTIGDVTFINDSKATNAVSTQQALNSFKDIIWIVGGQAKDVGLSGLEGHLSQVKHACTIGKDMAPIAKWLTANAVPYTLCGTMTAAVSAAHNLAKETPAKTILLSPACASFDQYKNFEKRGEDFEACVKDLNP